MKLILSAFLLAITLVAGTKERFDNYVVYNVKVDTPKQINELKKIEGFEYDFWKTPYLGHDGDIMVSPSRRLKFENLMKSLDIKYNVTIDNVQSLIDNEHSKNRADSFGWEDYYTLEEIYSWLDEKLDQYPTILSNHTVGKSFEGRSIRAVLLQHKPDNPLIIVEANIHAREWITSATATYLLNQLLTSTDPAIKELAENINWLIMPVFNVDGFSYTKTTNRMWRKTRQLHSTVCYGVDPNRNFDFEWLTIGASDNPCSENYAGPRPFSEPETKQWSEFVKNYQSKTKIYLALHSYGQYLMYPFGHTKNPPGNGEILQKIGDKAGEALALRYNTDYIVGQSSVVLYHTSGSSVDWAVNDFEEKIIGYTFELRDRRGGNYGFVLPANQIIPNCLEFMDGIVALIKEARALSQI